MRSIKARAHARSRIKHVIESSITSTLSSNVKVVNKYETRIIPSFLIVITRVLVKTHDFRNTIG